MVATYLFSILFYIIGFCIYSCKYKAVPFDSPTDIEEAERNPVLREKVTLSKSVKLMLIIGFFIPFINCILSIFYLLSACPEYEEGEFLYFNKSDIKAEFTSLFLNKDKC